MKQTNPYQQKPSKRIGLSIKLMINNSTFFLLSIIIASVLIYTMIQYTVEENIEKELTNSTDLIKSIVMSNANNIIRNYLRAVALKNTEIVHSIAEQYNNLNKSQVEAQKMAESIILSQTIGKTGYIYCINSQGTLVVHPKEALRNKNISEFDFVQKQITNKKGYIEYQWKNPDDDIEKPKALYMTYYEPWDWIISVSSYRKEFIDLLNIDEFEKDILNIRFAQTGYPYIINSKGLMIIHPKLKNKNVYNVKDQNGYYFVKEMCKNKKGTILYTWKNPGEKDYRNKMVVYDYIPEFDWIVASSGYCEEIYAPLTKIKRTIIFIIGMILIFFTPLSYLISRRLVRSLTKVTETAQKLASYDLTVDIQSQRNDELGDLLRAIHIMVEQFNHIIHEVNSNGENLLIASSNMEKHMNSIASSAMQMNSNANNVSSTTQQMALHIDMIAGAIESMSLSINELGEKAHHGSSIAEQAVNRASNAISIMKTLGESANVIGGVTDVIKRIADTTSLLALNADIEAASAGSVGKGFAVVANEIKEFARQSSNAAENIADQIASIQENSKNAIHAIYEIADTINLFYSSSEHTTRELGEQINIANEIVSNVTSANNKISDIAAAMTQLSLVTNEIAMSLGIAAKGTGQVKSQLKDDNNDINMTISALEVTTLSRKLLELVKQFKINPNS